MKILIKTKIFISYSREDQSLAKFFYSGLLKLGYDVFFDEEKILVGDDFSEKIKVTISNADCLLAIVSNNSIQSEWCKAEIYSSLAMEKKFIPIHYLNKDSVKIENPALFPKRINYLEVNDESDFDIAINKIHDMLSSTRKKVLMKFFKKVLYISLTLMIAVVTLVYLKNEINEWNHANLRKVKLEEIKNSSKIYNYNEIESISSEFYSDKMFQQQINTYSLDRNNSDIQRVNSLLISNHILKVSNNGAHRRWYLENFDIANNKFIDGNLHDMAFTDGNMSELIFERDNFNDISWNNRQSNIFFKSCYFSVNYVIPQSMVNVDFENCVFNGGELNLENMGDVSFYYNDTDPNSSTITNELALFENIIISNCVEPPSDDTIEILEPDSEVQFKGVLFENCRFKGFIRPSWFDKCIFSNCIFPEDFDILKLSHKQSIVQNELVSDKICHFE